MARNLLFSEVVQREVSPKVAIDDEEAARYWREHPEEFAVPEQRRVQEAVVRDEAALSADERVALATRLRDALIAGRSVAEAVADAGVEANVLVLDHEWIERGTLDAGLEAAVWELAAGGVAGPLPARGGLHVLHLLEIRPPSQRPLEQVRAAILNRMQEAEFDRLSREFLDELARNAYIVERLPEDAVGYRTAESGERDPVRALLRRAAGAKSEGESPASAPEPVPTAPAPPA
jgi:parvulin-like peptidyl-prolyl isomerase